jgi:hypothetical protein
MRHNNNGRRFRGRHNNGGGHSNNHSSHSSHNNQQRRINPRVQIFDSNGPEVRIRGNALQITEKYQTLARDANSAGDRVLAESYLQHAEHYQRMLNEAAEEFNRYNAQNPQQPQQHVQQQPVADGVQHQQPVTTTPPATDPNLSDLDQSFLVGPRHGAQQPSAEAVVTTAAVPGAGEQPSDDGLAGPARQRGLRGRPPQTTE